MEKSDRRNIAALFSLIEADTWVSHFVVTIANASVAEGHINFASDPSDFKRMAEEAVETFQFTLETSIDMALEYPDLFKEPKKTKLMLKDR